MQAHRDNKNSKINTTIGDLVEAVTEIALEAGKTKEEGYKLASLALESILRRNLRSEEPQIQFLN